MFLQEKNKEEKALPRNTHRAINIHNILLYTFSEISLKQIDSIKEHSLRFPVLKCSKFAEKVYNWESRPSYIL